MATSNYVQTDTAQVCSLANFCHGTGTPEFGNQAAIGGSVGSGEDILTVAQSQTDSAEYSFEVILPTDAESSAEDASIPINFSTGNMNCVLQSVYICRVNSSCVSQEEIGSETSIAFATNGGDTTRTIACSAVTFAAGDKVLIVLGFSEAGGHSSSTCGITPSQTMALPFNAPAGAGIELFRRRLEYM